MNDIVVVGPGGIGGVLAALLAGPAGCNVTVVGREGPHLAEIARSGLRLTGLADIETVVAATHDASTIRACDLLVLAVKAQHTGAALEAIGHIEVNGAAVSLQNGTAKDDALVATFGEAAVVGAVAIVAGELPAPGEVRWTYDGMTVIGELDGSLSTRVRELAELLANAGLNTEASASVVSATWTKTVGWVPIGLFATLARLTNAETLSDRTIATEYVGLVRELGSLAHARGIELQDFGPFHVGSWLAAAPDQAVELVMASPLASGGSTHSALQDIQRGQPTELRDVVGPLLDDARRLAVPMPRVSALYAALMGLESTL